MFCNVCNDNDGDNLCQEKKEEKEEEEEEEGKFKNTSYVEIPFTIDTNILNDITMLIG